mmetsp:Transcript_14755/g.27741  ORF Transcript_14755/g.27741 Transcript_14755/m.27741 type:complete len:985 (+) Transcript_14755:1829-4783(+)
MTDENPKKYQASVEPYTRGWKSQSSEDEVPLSFSFMTLCSRFDDQVIGTKGKGEEKAKASVPDSFIPKSFHPQFIHGKHRCVVCDSFPIVGPRLHYQSFKPDEGCCYACFEELFQSGSEEKRMKWLSSFIPEQLDSDACLQNQYRIQFPLLAHASRQDTAQHQFSLDDENLLIDDKVQNLVISREYTKTSDKEQETVHSNVDELFSSGDDLFVSVSEDVDDSSFLGKSFETFYSDDFNSKDDGLKVVLCTLSDDENTHTQKDVFIAFDSDKIQDDEVPEDDTGSNPSFLEDSFEIVLSDNSLQIIDTSVHDVSKGVSLLTQPLLESLLSFLPEELSHGKVWLNYSLLRDGASLQTLTQHVGSSSTNLMILQTSNGDVFGCYTSSPWTIESGYYGSGSSFVWRMRHKRSTSYSVGVETLKSEEKLQVFPNSNADHCVQFCSGDKLGIGKARGPDNEVESLSFGNKVETDQLGFAILLYDDLRHGSTSPSTSFSSPRLINTEDGAFEVNNMEVWSVANMCRAEEEEMKRNELLLLPSEISFPDSDLSDKDNKLFIAKDNTLCRNGMILSSQVEDSPVVKSAQVDPSNTFTAQDDMIQNSSSLVHGNNTEDGPTDDIDDRNLSLCCCDDILSGAGSGSGSGSSNQPMMLLTDDQKEQVSMQSEMENKVPYTSVDNKETKVRQHPNAMASSCGGSSEVIGHGDNSNVSMPADEMSAESRSEERMDETLSYPLWQVGGMSDYGLTTLNLDHEMKSLQTRFFRRIRKTAIKVFKLSIVKQGIRIKVNKAVEKVCTQYEQSQVEMTNALGTLMKKSKALASETQLMASGSEDYDSRFSAAEVSHEVESTTSRFWMRLLFVILLHLSSSIFLKRHVPAFRCNDDQSFPSKIPLPLGTLNGNERDLFSSDLPIAFIRKDFNSRDKFHANVLSLDITNHQMQSDGSGTKEIAPNHALGHTRKNETIKGKAFKNIVLDTLMVASDHLHNPFSVGF